MARSGVCSAEIFTMVQFGLVIPYAMPEYAGAVVSPELQRLTLLLPRSRAQVQKWRSPENAPPRSASRSASAGTTREALYDA